MQAQLVLIQSLTLALDDRVDFDASRLSLNAPHSEECLAGKAKKSEPRVRPNCRPA